MQVGVTPIAETPVRVSRHMSVHPLAATAPASFERGRPWQFVVGALAVAASVTMFLITRDAESDAATRPTAAIVETAMPSTHAAGHRAPHRAGGRPAGAVARSPSTRRPPPPLQRPRR